MDRHEVTREAFRAWVNSRNGAQANIPGAWADEQPAETTIPANHISHETARAYCKSFGGDTPTEVHWEYSARSGGQDIQYPWGNDEPTCELAILGLSECSLGRSHPVCSRPKGNTAQGLCDMSGNVWEWVRPVFPHVEGHDYPQYPGKPQETTIFDAPDRDVRHGFWEVGFRGEQDTSADRVDAIRGGGHWMTVPFYNRARARYFLGKGKTERNVGFRCMYPAERFPLDAMESG